jgi:NAD(P)-dependent dehydrogenase (short-subunit alcohol dehydrogenase family)
MLSPAYSASKSALNLLIGKYDAVYRAQGILFLSIAPGMVDSAEGCHVCSSSLTPIS